MIGPLNSSYTNLVEEDWCIDTKYDNGVNSYEARVLMLVQENAEAKKLYLEQSAPKNTASTQPVNPTQSATQPVTNTPRSKSPPGSNAPTVSMDALLSSKCIFFR